MILDWVPCTISARMLTDSSNLTERAATNRRTISKRNTRVGEHAFSTTHVTKCKVSLCPMRCTGLKEFHFDGLRVDAVASMLYLDYDRRDGEWRPNKWGGKENLEAIDFLRKLSCKEFEACPYALFVAEESTAFPKVTHPTYVGGLGFNFKWNMGWMNDVLSYMKTDTLWRAEHHNQLTFSMCYAYSENYVLPLSHDEVVHLKGSIINKMFGDYDTKFGQLKALLGFQYSHPGKKLNFMGVELAQWNEWNENKELDWMLLTYPKHDSHQKFVMQLNKTYKKYKALYQIDNSWEGFKWLLADDARNSVLAYERLDKKGNTMLVIINFSVYDYFKYGFFMDKGEYKLVLNSDEYDFGGRGVDVVRDVVTNDEGYAEVTIPASSVQYYYKAATSKKN